MVVFPDSAFAILGFDAIRRRILEGLSSPDAAALFRGERPADSPVDASSRLETTAEFQLILRADDPLAVGSAFDPRSLLHAARPAGSFLDAEDLRRLSVLAHEASECRVYLFARRENYPRLSAIAEGVVAAADFVEAVTGAIDERGDVRDEASPRLRRVRKMITRSEAALRDSLDRALADARSQGFDGGDQPTVRNGRMVIPVRAEAKRKVSGFIHDVSATGQTAFIEPTASLELNNALNELRAEEKQEIRRILIELTDAVREAAPDIQGNAEVLLRLDVLRAKAVLANTLEGVVPTLAPTPNISLRGARHPILLLRAIEGMRERDAALQAIVPLDLELGGDTSTIVISGPNAGGKTVVLKTLGLFALMISYGIPVPAQAGSVMFLPDHLLLDIGDEQSVDDGLSTFGARIVHLREIVRHAGPGTLVLFDEAGSGTDPAEGAALAQSVLEKLTGSGALTVASTHHQRLKVFAMQHGGVQNATMLIDAETLVPTYRFQAGAAGSSFGLAIARREGLGEEVVRRAEVLAGDESVRLDRLLAEQSGKIRALDEERRALQDSAEAVRQEKERLAAMKETLAIEKRGARQVAAREASAMIDAANARIERTIREIVESGADRKVTRAARAALEELRGELVAEAAVPSRPFDRVPGGPIKAGDRVIFDGGSATAEVLSIDGESVEISAGSMRMRVALSRLSKVSGPAEQQVHVRHPMLTPDAGQGYRIDVRGERVEPAIQRVMRFVDTAVAGGLHHVEILHGTGTGALRKAIQEYLQSRPDVSGVSDAPVDAGGAGVTVVDLSL